MKKPKVCFFDLETSLIKTTTFSLWTERLPHEGIIEDWFILSWAWKMQGEKQVHASSVLDFKRKSLSDDYGLVKSIREELEDVDVLVGHNARKFDIKKLNARLIYHRLSPLPQIQVLDTLTEAKKVAQFTSNRLDYLSKYLVGAGKEHTSPNLWMRCMNGDKKAMKEMVAYNKIDVVRLEEVYDVLLPYMKNHPHLGAMAGHGKESCNKCGSTSFEGGGKLRYTATGVARIQKQCKKCHGYSTFTVK